MRAARAARKRRGAQRRAASASSAARWRAPIRAPSRSGASPAGVIVARSERLGRSGRPAPVPVPGGSTSASPRAGVETYSLRDPQPERHQRLRHVRLERRDRLGQPLQRQLALVGHVDHHAQQPPAPERHDQHAAHPHVLERADQPVVERPAQAARRGERLDLGDHTPEAMGRGGRRSRSGSGRAGGLVLLALDHALESLDAGRVEAVPDSLLRSSRALSSVQAAR